MPDSSVTLDPIEKFIDRWKGSGAAERANYALFLSELCDVLGVERPKPTVPEQGFNRYVIDRAITRIDKDGKQTTVYADLYKRGCFMLETKQGAAAESTASGQGALFDVPVQMKTGHGKRGTRQWDKVLERAYHQARGYIRALAADEGRPPFLMVCDVGHVIELYAEFTGTGGEYLRFPDPKNHRVYLEDLRDLDTRELLRKIWDDPHSLDPSKHAAKVTREVSNALAKLAQSLEVQNHDRELIARFLQRLLFTLFAEDIGLLPDKSFEDLLRKVKEHPAGFAPLISQLWKEMASGTEFSTVLLQKVAHFNGGLFENPTAIPLNSQQIALLIHAAKQDWKEVEPAIFGTLLERALDPRERHKLGAHYTPRSYVERLIEPTLMQPLRDQWKAVKTAAALHHDSGKDDKARDEIQKFHHHLTHIKVLDPACGSGNFLYVALARIKELEAEVLDLLEELGGDRTLEITSFKVRPDQFLGIEINDRATAIAQLVLWIGYFQWHHKTTGKADTNDRPLLPKQHTIECRDAVLAYDERIPRTDPESGQIQTIWDGVTTKTHSVTGKEVPDESARKVLSDYVNPRRTDWPQADYIVGNPPFLGASRMRDGLGDGYVEALRKAWKKHKPDSWDFVMFWWHQAAESLQAGKTKRFGFITTNSIHQTFNRRCLEPFLGDDKKPVSLVYAIPDHPWVDSGDGAAVRIAMTVAEQGKKDGTLLKINDETEGFEGDYRITGKEYFGQVSQKLSIGANVSQAVELLANSNLSSQGMKLHGQGFLVDKESFSKLTNGIEESLERHVRPFWGPKDFLYGWSQRYAMDFDGLDENCLASKFPKCYNYLRVAVKPERDSNREVYRRENWWLFGRRNTKIREAIANLDNYIATPRTAKHRLFFRVDSATICESEVVVIGLQNYDQVTILSSNIHGLWALSQGSVLGPTPRYNNSRCFETFPFPDLDDRPVLREHLRDLGEKLDAHRKARQAEHPDLTLTGMYNVLEKLRKVEPLNDKDKLIHDQGLVTLLKQIHDEIDLAVVEAYRKSGFQPLIPVDEKRQDASSTPIADRLARGDEVLEQAILQNLVDLNHERAAEEAAGKIRYLRPDFQDPDNTQAKVTGSLDLPEAKAAIAVAKTGKRTWPKDLPEKVAVVLELLPETGADAAALDLIFGRASKNRREELQQVLAMLKSLGQI